MTGIMVPGSKRHFSVGGPLNFEVEHDKAEMAYKLWHKHVGCAECGYLVDAEDFVEAIFRFLNLAHIDFDYNDVNNLRELLHLKRLESNPEDNPEYVRGYEDGYNAGVEDIKADQTFYILNPSGHWEELMNTDPLTDKIKDGEIKHVENFISIGTSVPKGPGPGRYFALVLPIDKQKDRLDYIRLDRWMEVTSYVKW